MLASLGSSPQRRRVRRAGRLASTAAERAIDPAPSPSRPIPAAAARSIAPGSGAPTPSAMPRALAMRAVVVKKVAHSARVN